MGYGAQGVQQDLHILQTLLELVSHIIGLLHVCHEYLSKNEMVGWNLRIVVYCVRDICTADSVAAVLQLYVNFV